MDADRNFLFGLAALKSGLIDPVQLAEAGTEWMAGRDRSLADVMAAKGWISDDGRSTLEARVDDLGRAPAEAEVSTAVFHEQQGGSDLGWKLNGNLWKDDVWSSRYSDGDENFGERYRDASEHAVGGVGKVWRVRDAALGREVALKEIRPDRIDVPGIIARFLEEAKITAQLEHPNIAPVHELAEWAARPFYTMRFLGDSTLRSAVARFHLRKGGTEPEGGPEAFNLRGLLGVFVSVCNAIAYAHSKGVIHRDIKGQNVILGRFGEVIVLDWGLAKRLGSAEDPLAEPVTGAEVGPDCSMGATLPGQPIGTPNYMPPEQAAGDREHIDERSDVFGLGAMLYLILTGRPPFDGGDTPEVIRQAIAADPPRPRAINPAAPAALEAICLKAMRRDRDERYGSALELAQEVGRWLADEPVAAYPENPAARAGRWARKHQPAVAGIGALLVTASVALGLGTWAIAREEARIVVQKGIADDAKARALDDLNLALHRIERMNAVLGAKLPSLPQAEAIRLEVAEIATDLGRDMAERHPDYYLVRAVVGDLYREHANIHRLAYRVAEADAPDARAVRLIASLPEETRRSPLYALRLGNYLLEKAELQAMLGHVDQAESDFNRALGLAQTMQGRSDPLGNARHLEGRSLAELGALAWARGRKSQAVAMMSQAAAILRPLADRPGADARQGKVLVQLLPRLGVALRDRGDLPGSLARLGEALDRARALKTSGADDADTRFFEAQATLERDKTLSRMPGRARPGDAAFRGPIDQLRDLVKERPGVVEFRKFLASALIDRGTARDSARMLDPAHDDLDEAATHASAVVKEHPGELACRKLLASALVALARIEIERGHPERARPLLDQARSHADVLRAANANDPDLVDIRKDLDACARAIGPK